MRLFLRPATVDKYPRWEQPRLQCHCWSEGLESWISDGLDRMGAWVAFRGGLVRSLALKLPDAASEPHWNLYWASRWVRALFKPEAPNSNPPLHCGLSPPKFHTT